MASIAAVCFSGHRLSHDLLWRDSAPHLQSDLLLHLMEGAKGEGRYPERIWDRFSSRSRLRGDARKDCPPAHGLDGTTKSQRRRRRPGRGLVSKDARCRLRRIVQEAPSSNHEFKGSEATRIPRRRFSTAYSPPPDAVDRRAIPAGNPG